MLHVFYILSYKPVLQLVLNICTPMWENSYQNFFSTIVRYDLTKYNVSFNYIEKEIPTNIVINGKQFDTLLKSSKVTLINCLFPTF